MNPIKPDYYRTGKLDRFEVWYQSLPYDQYRAAMVSHADKYMNRIKENPVEDLEKAIYVLERLLEKEREQQEEDED